VPLKIKLIVPPGPTILFRHMKVPLPKMATEIALVETRTSIQEGVVLSCETRELFLEPVIDEFHLRLGQTNAHILGVVIQLLTRGKVRVDFRDYSIRLELLEGQMLMERAQAVAVFDDYIKRHKRNDGSLSAEVTQKIMVQAPRVSLPRAAR